MASTGRLRQRRQLLPHRSSLGYRTRLAAALRSRGNDMLPNLGFIWADDDLDTAYI
jgi:hypothetical protein